MTPENYNALNIIEKLLTNISYRDNWDSGMQINHFILLPHGSRQMNPLTLGIHKTELSEVEKMN